MRSYEAHIARGQEFLEEGRLHEAKREFNNAIWAQSDDQVDSEPEPHIYLAECYTREVYFYDAERCYDRAIELIEDDIAAEAEVYFSKAKMYRHFGLYKQALNSLLEVRQRLTFLAETEFKSTLVDLVEGLINELAEMPEMLPIMPLRRIRDKGRDPLADYWDSVGDTMDG